MVWSCQYDRLGNHDSRRIALHSMIQNEEKSSVFVEFTHIFDGKDAFFVEKQFRYILLFFDNKIILKKKQIAVFVEFQ